MGNKSKFVVLVIASCLIMGSVAQACGNRNYRRKDKPAETPVVVIDTPVVPHQPTGCPYGDSIPVDSDKCVPPTPVPTPVPAPQPVVVTTQVVTPASAPAPAPQPVVESWGK